MKEGVPEQWPMLTLAEVAELKGGLAKGKKRAKGETVRTVPYLRVANVQAGYLNLSEVHSIDASEKEISKILLQDGDVLFNEGGDRDKLGRGWVWEGQIPECIHQNHVFRARPRRDVIDPFFLSYWGNSRAAKEYFEEEGKQTVNLASISLAKLGGLPVPVPPLNEQRRIVAKLEALLAKVDTSRKRLERVPTILKRFRQAVLAAAVEGRLTEEWRQSNPQEERTETTLGEVATEFRTGPFGSSLHQSDYVRDGIPVINPTNIVDGSLVPNEDVTVSKETFGRLSDYALKVGDIVIARRGEMGRCAVVGEKERGWLCGTGSALIRLKRAAIPEFIQAFISAPPTRQFLIDGSVGSTMANLNQGIFKSVPISLPSVPEQVELLRRLSELNALADQIEARYTKAKTHVDRLTQSILAKAFRGELVAQDPTDEPAEQLLARLHSEAAVIPAAPRGRGRPPTPRAAGESIPGTRPPSSKAGQAGTIPKRRGRPRKAPAGD